jgi:glycosyltransferase involved in cell wall biosynthesis
VDAGNRRIARWRVGLAMSTMPAAPASSSVRLRICLYYPWLYLRSGGERTIIEIATRSRHRVTIVTNEYQADRTFPELRGLDVRVLERVPVKRSIGAVGIAMWRILRQRLAVAEYDALLILCEGVGDLVALRHPELPAFCVCLTPLRAAFDPHYRRECLASKGVLMRAAIVSGAAVFAAVDRVAWRRYRRIFPISREIQRRIEQGRLASADRMQVLNPGVDLAAFTPGPPRENVFFVPGRIMWTKNLILAIDAFRLFRRRVPNAGWRLRIAGMVDRKSQSYLADLQRHAGDDPDIEFCLDPDDTRLREMYRDCFATLFTAFNEDWGLVMIEAMASGKPVVAMDRGGPREIVRHEIDGLRVEGTPAAFAATMTRLVEDKELYQRLAANGPGGAARFGWEPFVRALDDEVERELAGATQDVERRLAEVAG